MESDRGTRAIALVSGGLDSVVSLAKALESLDVRLVLFLDYGQRALERERAAVLEVANYYGLALREVDIRWLRELSPEGMRLGAAGDDPLVTLDAVWIPNRNGVFLNVAASFAESYDCDVVVTGFNLEEAEEFPDNRAEYVDRVNAALELSTASSVRVVSFTQALDKPQIVESGVALGAPLSVIWSCYQAGDRMCGACASCRRLRAALQAVDEGTRPVIEFADGS